MENELPEVLYKYRTWRTEKDDEESKFHRKILTQNEIHFTSGRNFNDPFDCSVLVNFGGGTEEQTLGRIEFHLKEEYPDLSSLELREEAINVLNEGHYKDPKNKERVMREQQEDIYKNNGIFSLSGNRDSILMWSHYANQHKGFAVGFRGDILREFCDKLMQTKVVVDHYRVQYLGHYPLLNSIEMTDSEIFLGPLTTKSSDWAYEDEYRLIYMDGTNKVMTMFDTAYKEIILGCKMPEDHKEEIKVELRKNWPDQKLKLLQAKMKKNEFGLEFEEVEY